MKTFWDASAVVPLLLNEERSDHANDILLNSRQAFAWEWMLVEVEAALVRRRVAPDIWRKWQSIRNRFTYARFEWENLMALLSMNHQLGLRAGDAGHVHVFEGLNVDLPDLHMVTFDNEMVDAVSSLGLPLHPACTQS